MSFTLLESGFQTVDYVIFFSLISISCVGVFFLSNSTQIEYTADYLLGNKQMKTFPIAFSLIANCITGVTILETAAEVYNYGSQFVLILVAIAFSTFIVVKVYMPVFQNLNVSSSYQYLEIRFNTTLRAVASVMFLIDEIFFLPIVLYAPASVYKQLTGSDVYLSAALAMVVCGLYTSLGGLPAVVWTGLLQTSLMFFGIIVMALEGTSAAGEWRQVISVAKMHQKFILNNWDFSPCVRQTGWGSVIGGTVYWTCFNSVNQTMVQRYIALPSQTKVLKALAIFGFGCMVIISLCIWCGLTAWAVWASTGCEPSGAPLVGKELLPAFVTYVANERKIDGLSGLFLAAIFGAGLSSLSIILNACALVVVEDIMQGLLKQNLKPKTKGWVARGVTLLIAGISILLCTITAEVEVVMGIATVISNIVSSTTCGVFTLGMLCYWVGPKGALAGAIAGTIVTGCISLGITIVAIRGWRYPATPIHGYCAKNSTKKNPTTTRIDEDEIFALFRISHHWIVPIGLLTTLLVGAIVGYCKDKKTPRDRHVYSPVIWKYFPLNNKNITWPNVVTLLPPQDEKRLSIFISPNKTESALEKSAGSDNDANAK